MRVHYRSRLAKVFLPKRYVAITLLDRVFTPLERLPERVLRHERAHVEQWKRYGIARFPLLYLWYHFRYGYGRNPFEVEARSHEDGGLGSGIRALASSTAGPDPEGPRPPQE